MRIVEDTPSCLVLRARSLWVSYVCFGGTLVLAAASIFTDRGLGPLFPAALLALFGFAFLRATDVVLDKERRRCTIRRRDMLRVTRREVGFDEITDVLVDTMMDTDVPGQFTCRLSLSTKGGPIPFSAVYQPDLNRYEGMRDTLVKAIFAGGAAPPAADPVRSLLSAGRMIDAIGLLRTRDGLGLTEARAKAEAMRNEIAA
jgi:hypothetical protein